MAKVKKTKNKEKASEKSESKAKDSKEEVCEVFDIEKKDGKVEEKRVCDLVEKKKATKEDIKKLNKTLRNILIGLGIIVALILLSLYFLNSVRHFSYRGVEGDVVKEGEIIFHKVAIPLLIQGQKIDYNIYLRHNPEKLDPIPFEGEIVDFDDLSTFSDGAYRLILNVTGDLKCNDDDLISIGNMMNLKALNFKVMKDENATCDGRYIYLHIKESDYTGIKQIGDACYEAHVADCEILKVTERFMVEMFVKHFSE